MTKLFLFLFFSLLASEAFSAVPLKITMNSNMLISVEAREVPLEKVMNAIAKRFKLDVLVEGPLKSKKVTLHIENKTIEEVIRQILLVAKIMNSAIEYKRDGFLGITLTRVWLKENGKTAVEDISDDTIYAIASFTHGMKPYEVFRFLKAYQLKFESFRQKLPFSEGGHVMEENESLASALTSYDETLKESFQTVLEESMSELRELEFEKFEEESEEEKNEIESEKESLKKNIKEITMDKEQYEKDGLLFTAVKLSGKWEEIKRFKKENSFVKSLQVTTKHRH